jgi:hypothetical protein
MAPFDFSKWTRPKGEHQPKFRDLGLTIEQVNAVLADQHGITELLLQEFEQETRRGGVPHASIKALAVFEHYDRDTSYAAIAAAMNVKKETAKEYMREARAAVRTALGIEITTEDEVVRLVNANDARQRSQRVLNVFNQQVKPALKKLELCAASLRNSNSPVQLSPKIDALLHAANLEEVA